VQEFEAHQALAWEYREHTDADAAAAARKLDESIGILPAEYDEARGIASRAERRLAEIFDDVDVLLTFSAPGAARRGWTRPAIPASTVLWTS
jgi:hypothetical protein